MRRLQLTAQDIHQLAQSIWNTLFEADLELVAAEPPSDGSFITGCIQISGAWEGAVVMRSSVALARRLAAQMLGLEEPEDADICDAMGELTNLMAGAAQTLLPAPSELTPPSVIEGKDYKLVLPHFAMANDVPFVFHDEPLSVLIFDSQAQPALHQNINGIDQSSPD